MIRFRSYVAGICIYLGFSLIAASLIVVGLAATALASAAPAFPGTTDAGRWVDADATPLALEINKGLLIRLDHPASDVFIANPKVADIQVKSPRLIYLFGTAQGETSFYAVDDDDRVIYGASVSVIQNLSRLRTAIAQLLPDTRITVSAIGDMVVLSGHVMSPLEADTAVRLAQSLSDTEEVMNRLSILQPTQVNLRVRIAEVSRNVLKQIGFNWEGGLFGGSFGIGAFTGRDVVRTVRDTATNLPTQEFIVNETVSSIFGSITTGNLDLNYAIDALDQEGFLRVLAEPNLTAITGENANFLAGGEFPVPVPNLNGIGIEYRAFGISLDLTPTVLDTGRISMRVRPEVSDLSTAGALRIDGIAVPSISTRRAETTIELGSGQSFAIAGLLQNRTVQDARKVPGLGDIPILGALFRSDDFRREETELLIVVTPYVVRPVDDRMIVLPTDGFTAPGDADRYLKDQRWRPGLEAARLSRESGRALAPGQRAGFQLP